MFRKRERLTATKMNELSGHVDKAYSPVTQNGVIINGSRDAGLSISRINSILLDGAYTKCRAYNSGTTYLEQFRPGKIQGMRLESLTIQDVINDMVINIKPITTADTIGIMVVALERIAPGTIGMVAIDGIVPCYCDTTQGVVGGDFGISGLANMIKSGGVGAKMIYKPATAANTLCIVKVL